MPTITGPQIDLFRLKVLHSALRLEILGMKRRGRSVYSIVKQEFNLKGSKTKVLEQFTKIVESQSTGSINPVVENVNEKTQS